MATDLSFFARTNTNLPDCNGRVTCLQPPVCPACGGLECLCRPRFFAGQLLTEEDLNRLDHYVVAKNRLHNRYLVGWGVACGLEVVCNACTGVDQVATGVLVKPGYALSPCGNDIVLCKTEPVDICALINACRPPQDQCYDLFTTPQATPTGAAYSPASTLGGVRGQLPECDGGSDDWVLAVCYSEKPSRGVTALLRAATSCTACKCGGNCGCGGQCSCQGTSGKCSCGTNAGAARSSTNCGCGNGKPAPNPNLASALPDQCEPTMTCEGYRFVVYKAPTKSDVKKKDYGAAAKRFLCCILPQLQNVGSPTQAGVRTPQQAIDWVYTLRDTVRDFILNEGFYDCQIAARLMAVGIPTYVNTIPADQFTTQITAAAYGVIGVGLLVLQKCLCAAFLPPCPDPAQLDCVPLATVTVTRGSCRVLRVCNVGVRKFLVTIPNITYWLSFFTSGKSFLRPLLEAICCTPLVGRYTGASISELNLFRQGLRSQAATPGVREAVAPGTAPDQGAVGSTSSNGSAFTNLFLEALMNPNRNVTVENLLLAALDARDADGNPFATPEELANPTEFILLNEVVAPLLRQFAPTDRLGVLGALGDLAGGTTETGATGDLAREVEDLKARVADQERMINELRNRNP